MAYQRYVALVVAVFVVIGSAVIYLGAVTEPYVGDVSRLGGYRERDFGWQQPQQRIVPHAYVMDRYAPGSDMLIIGDSMTLHRQGEQTDLGVYWQNWLHARTGWKISVLHRREVLIEEVLASPEYRAQPPHFLVLEFAERAITGLDRITASVADRRNCEPSQLPPPSLHLPPLAYAPQRVKTEAFDQLKGEKKTLDLSLGGHQLKQAVLRTLLPGRMQIVPFAMNDTALFSNREPGTALVYHEDLLKLGTRDDELRQHWCGLRALQDRVEADGRTQMIILMVPDKLSTYAPYIANLPQGYPAIIPALARYPGLHFPRVDLAFASALQGRAVDLFMPNDTHPGYLGHQLIAEALLRDLEQRGFVRSH